MTDKFKNTYRISSARATWWDYNADAAYFATICTKDHISYFGDVIDGVMALSEIGNITQQCWEQIPIHFPFVILDEFVVMPNHVHGIIIIHPPPVETLQCNASTGGGYNASTTHINNINQKMSAISPKSGSLSTIIRSYKSACSKHIRIQFPDFNFAWQSRYHDRVIRNEREYHGIVNYIMNNPKNWVKDELNISLP